MKRASRLLLLAVLVVVLVAGTGFVVRQTVFKPQTILANFSSATSLYPGDDVRIAGVKVGTIRSISPQPDNAVVTLDDRPRRARPGRRQGGDRGPEPGRRPLRATCPAVPQRRTAA